MKTISDQELLKLFRIYPSYITSIGTIVFLEISNYNIEQDIQKSKKELKNIEKRLNKLSNTLSQNSFYDNASGDIIVKLCNNLLKIEDLFDISNQRLIYLQQAIQGV